MSIKTVHRVKCDNCGTTAFPRSTASQARYEASQNGWRVGKGKRGRDLCPECKEEETDGEEPDYRRAIGVIPWKEGDEPAEVIIRRMRDGQPRAG